MLNEELRVQEAEELFFEIVNDFIEENYVVSKDHQMTDEEAYITSIIMDHFIENYKIPDLQESVIETMTGRDINDSLYEELAFVLLDEGLGKYVAGAAHGIRNIVSKIRASRATSAKDKAKSSYEKHLASPGSRKTKADVEASKEKGKDYGTGAKGEFKKSFSQARIETMKKRAERAKQTMKDAETRRKSAVGKHQANKAKSEILAKKVDQGVENIKNKIKDTVSRGAAKVGSKIGSVAGRFA